MVTYDAGLISVLFFCTCEEDKDVKAGFFFHFS